MQTVSVVDLIPATF